MLLLDIILFNTQKQEIYHFSNFIHLTTYLSQNQLNILRISPNDQTYRAIWIFCTLFSENFLLEKKDY